MYSIEFHEDVNKDFKELGYRVTALVFKKLKKLAQNPIIGDELGNKANYDLAGYRKVYVDNKRIRIVYSIIEDKIEVLLLQLADETTWRFIEKLLLE